MKQIAISYAHAIMAMAVSAIVWGGVMPAYAQTNPAPAMGPPSGMPAGMQGAAPVTATANTAPIAAPPSNSAAQNNGSAQTAGPQPNQTQASGAAKATPDDTNPFSNVKPVDNQALREELPAIEQKLQQMQNQMSAIQQVQLAMPADALNGPSRPHAAKAAGPGAGMDEESMTLEASTFVACVNGQAMFRDADQKPFFIDAKEANQNEAVRRIGGCKH